MPTFSQKIGENRWDCDHNNIGPWLVIILSKACLGCETNKLNMSANIDFWFFYRLLTFVYPWLSQQGPDNSFFF
jgi:hypothetical protein